MSFDLLIFGLFLLWLTKPGEKRRERDLNIQRYQEEIEDYLGWDEKEAMYRIVGNIKRLNREGITNIYLKKANLKGADLHKANLEGANLTDARLEAEGGGLTDANLEGATYDENTVWPEGFDPKKAGATNVDQNLEVETTTEETKQKKDPNNDNELPKWIQDIRGAG